MRLRHQGDGLEMLRGLPDGTASCIYLDPPWGTGRTFDGYDDSMSPDDWDAAMRAMIAESRRVLARDGVIWLHLDRFAIHRGKTILDDALGARASLGLAAWQRTRTTPRSRGLSATCDFLAVSGGPDAKLRRLPRRTSSDLAYRNPDGDPRGRWRPVPLGTQDSVGSDGRLLPGVYGLEHPVTRELLHPPLGQHWAWSQDRLIALYASSGLELVPRACDPSDRASAAGAAPGQVRPEIPDLVLAEVPDGWTPPADGDLVALPSSLARKLHLADAPGASATSWWTAEECGTTADAKRHLKRLLPGRPFPTPKPERLLGRIIELSTDPGDLVADPYGGSGTTAAVAAKLGRGYATAELNPSTFAMLEARLDLVEAGKDPGGITMLEELRSLRPLPDGATPEDAAELVRLLGLFAPGSEEPAILELRRRAATRTARTPRSALADAGAAAGADGEALVADGPGEV